LIVWLLERDSLANSFRFAMLYSEQKFYERTEGIMGEWVQVGPAGRRAYLATPESGAGPGVLVLHAWWGLTSVFTDVCDRLAAAGFVALAPDLYATGATTDSIAEAEKLVAAHDRAPGEAEAVLQAAVDYLRESPVMTGGQIGVVGFSLGAYWALHLSQVRPDEISAVVAFYGSGGGDFTAARAAYLGHFAENDDFEPLESVRELETTIREAGREVAFYIYPGTGHWFVEPNRPDAYSAEAAALAWERTFAFLNAQLA
jgi:carboxymethylenebutenolidase